MVDYGLKDKVALITGTNNPQGIGAATALAFAREGASLVLVYRKISRIFDESKTGKNGVDRYYKANAGDNSELEEKLRKLNARFLVLEKDISDEKQVKEICGIDIDGFDRTTSIRPELVPGLDEQKLEPTSLDSNNLTKIYYFTYEGQEYFICEAKVYLSSPDKGGEILQYYQNYK